MLCSGYGRVVVGDYGAFVEFSKDHLVCEPVIAPGQEYRVNDERYSKNVKYIWLTVNDGSGIKIYFQKNGVSYADYKAGMYYVSVHEVFVAELRHVLHAKWTLNKDGSGTCPVCGSRQHNCWDLDNWDNFCHHCGTDMRGTEGGIMYASEALPERATS